VTVPPVAILGCGMMTGVGLTAEASCAAIRCAIDNFQETRFRDRSGEWIMGCEVPLAQPWRGETKLLRMAAGAIAECLEGNRQIVPESTPLLLCLAEAQRPGRMVSDDGRFFRELEDELHVRFHEQSRVIPRGHVSAAVAVRRARSLLNELNLTHVIVAATDSLLAGSTLGYYEEKERLLTSTNSDGFIPGEAAAAFVIQSVQRQQEGQLICCGLGFGVEKAHIDSEDPLRADGLTQAIEEALRDAGYDESILDFKIFDASGEQYRFKEASLAFGRIDRSKRTELDVSHPADCVGEVGAAIGPVMIAVLKAGCAKGYAKGSHILMHLGDDDGKRSCMIFSWQKAES
jgi:3-oxoacyl-[acyl-carrier-protein] synthase-1